MLQPRRLVDVADARRPARGVHRDLAGHRVREDVQVARGQRRGDVHRRRLVVRADGAAALAARGPEAGRPVPHVLGQDPLGPRIARMEPRRNRTVVERAGENRPPDGDDRDAKHAPPLPREKLAYPRLWGRQQAALRGVGRVLEAFIRAADADQHLDLVVVRRHVLVGYRPVESEPVAAARLEIVGPVAKRVARPVVCPAPQHPRAPPPELPALLRGCVRVGLAGHLPAAADRGVVEPERLVGRSRAPQGRGSVCLEHRRLRNGVVVAPRLDHQDFRSSHREGVRRVAAGRAGTDHENVISVRNGRRVYECHRDGGTTGEWHCARLSIWNAGCVRRCLPPRKKAW